MKLLKNTEIYLNMSYFNLKLKDIKCYNEKNIDLRWMWLYWFNGCNVIQKKI